MDIIEIRGASGTGKSPVAHIMEAAFQRNGFIVEVIDHALFTVYKNFKREYAKATTPDAGPDAADIRIITVSEPGVPLTIKAGPSPYIYHALLEYMTTAKVSDTPEWFLKPRKRQPA